MVLLVLVPPLLLGYYKMCRKEGMYRRLECIIQCEQLHGIELLLLQVDEFFYLLSNVILFLVISSLSDLFPFQPPPHCSLRGANEMSHIFLLP